MSIETQYESLEFYLKDFADTKEILEVNKGLVTDTDIKIEQIEVAIEAIRKQIPMSLIKKRLEDKNTGKCPVCSAQMQFFGTRESCYCYNCGQAIELW